MEVPIKKAIVIGAGLGGLCTAITLQKEGWQVTVFDKANTLAGVGGGIVLAANAMKVLEKLGVAQKVRSEGAPIGKAEIRTWDGKLLVNLPTSMQAQRYGTHSYLIHRAVLQTILHNQLDTGTRLHLNKKLLKFEQDGKIVTAIFADGTREEGDILIGADGIHSSVREQLLGSEKLRYAGYMALRGICSFKDERYSVERGGGFEAWGPGKRFGYTHLGQGLTYWFAAINSPQGVPIPPVERKRYALDHFRGWYKPIEAVIKATDESAILAHDIFDRKPLSRWSQGRVTLLGDAAHPMLPNLGQGGAQAMEDAVVLARCLRENVSNEFAALLAYEQSRIPRTTKIVCQSRRMGRLVQLESPIAIGVRNLIVRAIPPNVQAERLHWMIGYDEL